MTTTLPDRRPPSGARTLRVGASLKPLALITSLLVALGYSAYPAACGNDDLKAIGSEGYAPMAYGDHPTLDELTALGRKIFFDPSLSASGKQACASCHDPAHAFASPNALPVQRGGPNLDRTGFRNTPSLRYVHAPVAFTEHFLKSEVSGGSDDEGPTGGRTWDGRVSTGHEQALMPMLDANEMANADTAEILARLRQTAYADDFRKAVSRPNENVFDTPDEAIIWLTVALEAFEQSRPEFHPFTSKFDAYLNDQVDLTPKEKRGLALFNDVKKGNCASCHNDDRKNPTDRLPIFTDFGYVALAVPRNRALAANADPKFFDLGLCGPLRSDLKKKTEYCGMFRTPSLRNVALRQRYFHNGRFASLREVLDFYVTRDIHPAKWYPAQAGQAPGFDDLAPQYWGNVYKGIPFAPLPGNRPRLNAREIDDIVAFLGTLSDGFVIKPAPRRTTPRRTLAATGPGAR